MCGTDHLYLSYLGTLRTPISVHPLDPLVWKEGVYMIQCESDLFENV